MASLKVSPLKGCTERSIFKMGQCFHMLKKYNISVHMVNISDCMDWLAASNSVRENFNDLFEVLNSRKGHLIATQFQCTTVTITLD
jgi:hypothetical protein